MHITGIINHNLPTFTKFLMYLLYQKTPVSSTILAIKSEIISLFIAKLLICYNLCGIIKSIELGCAKGVF